MSFFQNPFNFDFRGNWILGDRQQALVFECKRNTGRSEEMVMAWNAGPYDLSGTDADGDDSSLLTIKFTIDMEYKTWAQVTFNLGNSATTTADDIVDTLNGISNFSTYFSAAKENNKVFIRQKLGIHRFRFFVVNGGAEEKLQFNARAGVAELPTYFSRHTVGNDTFADCNQCLIELDVGDDVPANIVDDAVDAKGVSLGLDSGTVKEDWEMLEGRSGIFHFQNITVDGSDRITEIIEYPTGAVEGSLARKISYVYSGSNTKPSSIFEVPYTLESGDLIEP